jgi:excisionase family DNA binding protein
VRLGRLRLIQSSAYLKTGTCGGSLLGMNMHTGGLPPQPTIKQTAGFFCVDEKTVRRWIAQGRLTAYRVGPRRW